MSKKIRFSLPKIIGIVLVLIALYGFSPWITLIPASVVQVGPVEIREIPPYDATRIGVSTIILIAGAALLLEKVPFVKS